jgi:large subunit ribosomal protein L30
MTAKSTDAKSPGVKNTGARIKVTLVKSVASCRAEHRATVRGLGLRRIRHTVEVEDTPAVRGMINSVGYLVRCEG